MWQARNGEDFVSGMGWHMGKRKEKTEICWPMKEKKVDKREGGGAKTKGEEVGN